MTTIQDLFGYFEPNNGFDLPNDPWRHLPNSSPSKKLSAEIIAKTKNLVEKHLPSAFQEAKEYRSLYQKATKCLDIARRARNRCYTSLLDPNKNVYEAFYRNIEKELCGLLSSLHRGSVLEQLILNNPVSSEDSSSDSSLFEHIREEIPEFIISEDPSFQSFVIDKSHNLFKPFLLREVGKEYEIYFPPKNPNDLPPRVRLASLKELSLYFKANSCAEIFMQQIQANQKPFCIQEELKRLDPLNKVKFDICELTQSVRIKYTYGSFPTCQIEEKGLDIQALNRIRKKMQTIGNNADFYSRNQQYLNSSEKNGVKVHLDSSQNGYPIYKISWILNSGAEQVREVACEEDLIQAYKEEIKKCLLNGKIEENVISSELQDILKKQIEECLICAFKQNDLNPYYKCKRIFFNTVKFTIVNLFIIEKGKFFNSFSKKELLACLKGPVAVCHLQYLTSYLASFSEKERIEIAQCAAKEKASCIASYIQGINIDASTSKGQKALIKIAKLAAQQNGGQVSQYIQDFGINAKTKEGKKALIEIAKLAAKQDGFETSKYIQNYQIDHATEEGQKALITIATLAAKQSGQISEWIGNYKINKRSENGQKALIKIAKLAAQEDGASTSKHIKKYGINKKTQEGQQALIEIAKLAARQEGAETSCFIKNYGIHYKTQEGQQALIEIAKVAAKSNGKMALYIKNYNIQSKTEEGQQALIQIAKYAAQNDQELIGCLDNFKIRSKSRRGQKARFAILKTAVRYQGAAPLLGLECTEINFKKSKTKARLLKLASMGITQTPNYGMKAVNNSVLTELLSPQERLRFNFLSMGSGLLDETLEHMDDFSINTLFEAPCFATQLYSFAQELQKINSSQSLKDNFNIPLIRNKLIAFGKEIGFNLEPIIRELTFKKGSEEPLEEHIAKNNLIWLIESLFLIGSKAHLADQLKENKESIETLLIKCCSIHNPELKKLISKLGIESLNETNLRQTFLSLRAAKKNEHFYLPHLLIPSLMNRGLSEEFIKEFIIKPIESLGTAIKDRKFNEALYRFIAYCYVETTLSKEDLENLIQLVFQKPYNKSSILASCDLFRNIGLLGGVKCLKKNKIDAYRDKVDDYFLKIFKQSISIKQRDKFGVAYQQTFGSCRNPQAILTYASSLKKLPTEQRVIALKALATYVDLVLDGVEAFKAKRLEIANNPHLETIFKVYPESFKQIWATSLSSRPLQVAGIKDSGVLDIQDYFVQKIVVDKHVNLPTFQNYLEAKKEEKEAIYKSIQDNTIEKLLMEISQEAFKALDLKSQQTKVDQIIEKAYALNNAQFIDDLKSLKALLDPEYLKTSRLTLMESDDPFDLLLCGTEVEGSCQRVGGQAAQNRGLLGYLLDGKNRLIVIKGADGKIRGRALLRLVWDETEKKAVVMLSRVYPIALPKEYQEQMVELAKEKAQSLKLDLVSVETGVGIDSYPNALSGLGGPAPYEYVDESFGVMEKGIYECRHAYYLDKA